MELDPEEKLMQEQMGFSNFTASWQTKLDEKEEEVEMKEEMLSYRCEEKVDEEEAMGEQEEEEEKEGIHLHFKMDTTLRAKDRVYISSYGNQV